MTVDKRLLIATECGDVKTASNLLEVGVDIEAKDEIGRTALHLAAKGKHIALAKVLLEKKADVNAKMCDEITNPGMCDDSTPIFYAVANGHDEMVSLLLDHGADSNLTDDIDWNLLHWTAHEGYISTARLLIARCPLLINKTKFNGLSPLHFAAETGNLEMVKLLVHHKANITKSDDNGDTPISIAERNGHIHVAEYLRSKLIHRQERTQSKFFNHTRSKKSQTNTLVQHYLDFRRVPDNKDKVPLEAVGIPGRRLIMGDSGALKESLTGLDEKTAIPPEIMARHGKWYNGGLAEGKKVSASWSREYVYYPLDADPGTRGKEKKLEEVTISSQYNPLVGHRGNFFMAGIGKYGTGDNDHILFVINEATRVEPADATQQATNEKRLARLFLEYARKGAPITRGVLQKQGFHVPHKKADRVKQLHYLNRVCYLTVVKEVSRRMYPGAKKNGSVVEELPMGLAHVMALRLIADGRLKMQQVFGENAPYGLPTSSEISTERETDLAKKKLAALTDLFYKTYPDLGSSREDMHQILLKGYGGESDTSGDEYETSDEEKEKAIRHTSM